MSAPRFWFSLGRLCFFASEGSLASRLLSLRLRLDEEPPASCFYCGAKTTMQPYRVAREYVYPACCIRDACLDQWTYVHISKTSYDIEKIRDGRNVPGNAAAHGFLDAESTAT